MSNWALILLMVINMLNKKHLLALAIGAAPFFSHASEADVADTDARLKAMQERIDYLEKSLNQKLELLANSVEQNSAGSNSSTNSGTGRTHIGGYGEMHYRALNEDGEDTRELDFHRMVLFFGHEFNEHARFVTEFEVEHVLVSDGAQGAVEIEQVYVEMDLGTQSRLRTGVMLMPIGIINETHEPPAFYGVERPVIETSIIPTTWYSAGLQYIYKNENGLRVDLMLSEGLKTDDPSTDPSLDPFNLKNGKQKGSFADAYDLAMTARVVYTGHTGLELAAYSQYQPDLDQSAEESYADAATLLGGHAIYQSGKLTGKVLYARWDLAGDAAKTAGKNLQHGGYAEADWRQNANWGFFARHSVWSQEKDQQATQSDVGLNYYPYEDIVFKADIQMQNADAGNADGFNLGFGYQF
ncbi:MAG: hypothetical protein H7A10_02705 [Oceanospirillaceae bacterium]|nr:hypothetical protein [Oceanospirillaceae bacterium]